MISQVSRNQGEVENMQPGKGMANNLFSFKFVSICKWVQTSFKHRILPLPPLPCLPFRLLMRNPSKDSNCPPLQQANMQSGKGMANNLFSLQNTVATQVAGLRKGLESSVISASSSTVLVEALTLLGASDCVAVCFSAVRLHLLIIWLFFATGRQGLLASHPCRDRFPMTLRFC